MIPTPLERPPGAPQEWPKMSRYARQEWLARHRREQAAKQAAQRAKDKLPDGVTGLDRHGRYVWTREAMLAADAARGRARRGTGPALTGLQRDAVAALRRAQEEAKRRAGGARKLAPGDRRTPAETTALVLSMRDKPIPDICAALDRAPASIARALERMDERDLYLAFRRYEKRLR